MNLRLKCLTLAAVAALSACSSTPTHYYTLVAPMKDAAPVTSQSAPLQFEVLPVLMQVQVDQPPLVVRQGNGSLSILDTERWGAPLGDEFHDALTSHLERRLGSRDMAGLPKNRNEPVLSVRADVRRFESVAGQYALIDVVWNLGLRSASANGTSQRSNLTCSSVIREQAGASVESLVLAHQQAVARLADSIARTASAWAQQPATRCP